LSRLSLALGAGALLAEAAGILAIIFSSDRDPHTAYVVLSVVAGGSFVVAGLVALWRRPENRTGLYLAATGYLWYLGGLNEASNEWLFAVGFAFGATAFVPLAALVLGFPTGRLSTRIDRALPIVIGAVIFGSSLVALLLSDHPAAHCDDCPSSPITITNVGGLAGVVDDVSTALATVVALAVLVRMAQRWLRATPALRRALWPVLLSGGLVIVLVVAAAIVSNFSDPVSNGLQITFLVALAAMPVAFLAGILRGRLARASVARLLVELDRGVELKDALARALGDPSVEIAYWLPDRGGWVDASGRSVAEPVSTPRRVVTTVERDGERVAGLIHDASLDDEPELVSAVAAAAGLSLHTQRLQAELRAQYEFLITVVNTAPSLLVVVDTEGRIRNQNRAVLDASGYRDEELVRGRYFWDVFIDEHEREAARRRFTDAAPDFEPTEYENAFTNQNGERRVIDWRSAPVRDETGAVVSIIAGGIDITDRKRRELELQGERDATDTLVQTVPTLIVVVDDDARILSEEGWAGSNRAFKDTLGWPDEAITGRSVIELIHPDDAYAAVMGIASAANGVPAVERESRWRKANGESVVVEWTATPMPDPSGLSRRLVLISATDVTERALHEEELRRQRDHLSIVARSTPSLIAVIDSNAAVSHEGVNRAFQEAIGLDDADTVGRNLAELVGAPEDAGLFAAAAEPSGVGVEHETTWRSRYGEELRVAWSTQPLDLGYEQPRYLVHGIDVTERNRQAEEIRASRTRIVQAADDARRKLERNLHDGAQQRLVALSVSLRLAEAKLSSDPNAAGAIIAAARDELAHALEELRELARGIHPAVLTDRGLAAAIEALVTRTPVPVEVELQEEPLPPSIEAAIYYVVSESLANVVKYAGATLVHVRIGLNGDGNVVAEVADDGAGGADPGTGSGLRGLADRVEALNGTLSVDSPRGHGTCVRVEIPVPVSEGAVSRT
jgi:PAS domain S-box-containing protein